MAGVPIFIEPTFSCDKTRMYKETITKSESKDDVTIIESLRVT